MVRGAYRHAPRIDVDWVAQLELEGGTRLLGTARDASLSGAFVSTPGTQQLQENQSVIIRFSGENGETVEARGFVSWHGRSERHACDGVGIQFGGRPESLSQWYTSNARRFLVRKMFELKWPPEDPSGELPH